MKKSILITPIVVFGALSLSCRNTTREAAAQAEVDSLKTEWDNARTI